MCYVYILLNMHRIKSKFSKQAKLAFEFRDNITITEFFFQQFCIKFKLVARGKFIINCMTVKKIDGRKVFYHRNYCDYFTPSYAYHNECVCILIIQKCYKYRIRSLAFFRLIYLYLNLVRFIYISAIFFSHSQFRKMCPTHQERNGNFVNFQYLSFQIQNRKPNFNFFSLSISNLNIFYLSR